VLAVGDAEFQRRCLGRMQEFGASGRTVLFVSHNMQAVARLCDRSLLFDDGRIVRDGPSSEVVAAYLQSGYGSGSYQAWPDLETAPGNSTAKMAWVRVVQDGETVDTADVRRPIGIEIAFRILRPGPPLLPKLKLSSGDGDVVFNALDTDPRWSEPIMPGEYVSTAWIPGNLLNEGFFTVDVGVCEAGVKLHAYTGAANVVSFNVHDPGEGDSSRGRFTGRLRGNVRPLLEWTTTEL
jgi:lipopolysaccharide transport system ATP-binding protein